MNLGIRYVKKAVRPGLLFLGILISFVLTSCSKESVIPVSGGSETSPVTFTLSLPANSIPSTRSLAGSDESAVGDIQILAFQDDKYIYTEYCNSIAGNRFTVSLRTGTYDFVVLANSLDIVSGLSLVSGTTNQYDVLDELVKSTTAGTGWISDPSAANYQKIPMSSGVMSLTINDNSTAASVSLYRMLAKINIEVMPTAQSAFKLESIRLYNYNTTGRVFPVIDWDGTVGQTNLPASPGTVTGDVDPALRYTGITGGVSCKETIYTFEAVNGSASTLSTNPCIVIGGSYNKGPTTYYRIDFAVRENNTDVFLSLLRNHRYEMQITSINGPGFSDESEAFNSLPINIEKKILIVDESLTDITYDGQYMLAFGENDIVLTMEQARSGIEIASSYDYNSSGAGFTRWKATVTQGSDWLKIYPESSVLANTIMTYTAGENKSGALRKAVISVTSGRLTKTITITQGIYAHPAIASNPSNCYMVQPGDYAVKIPVSRTNEGVSGSVGSNDILDGDLLWTDCPKGLSINSAVHRILSSGTGSGGHLIVIPGKTAGNAVVTLKTSADGYQNIKWSWHIWNTDYDPDMKNNGTTHTYAGSAFSNGGSLYGKTLMDRNLGATWTASDGLPIAFVMTTGGVSSAKAVKTYGLLFQWGRKDPLTPSNGSNTAITIYGPDGGVLTENGTGIVTATVSEANNLTNSIQNPMTFYYSTNLYDWYSNVSSDDQLWNSAAGKKTVLDPCPEGWRVPAGEYDAANPWNDFNTETNFPWYVSGVQGSTSGVTAGRLYTGNGTENYAWYPAGGYRDYKGEFFAAGNFGHLWTATAWSGGGYFVSITPNPNPFSFGANSIFKSSGHSVRCVRE